MAQKIQTTTSSENSQTGFRPRLACQLCSHANIFLALLLSPCWPIICRMFVGLYLSTHNRDSDVVSETTETSGLWVSCDVWLSCVGGVVVMPLSFKRSPTLPRDNGVATVDGVADTYSSKCTTVLNVIFQVYLSE